ALDDVDELRQLVDAPPPQPAADTGDAAVVARGLYDDVAIIGRGHGAELDDAELLLVESVAPLQEENGPAAVEADEKRDGQQEGQKADQNGRRDGEVEEPLLQHFERRQRLARELQAGDLAEARDAHILEAVEDALRPEMDLGGDRQQLLDALIDGLAVGPWHGDEHRVGRERARRIDGLTEIGVQLLGADGFRRSRLDRR